MMRNSFEETREEIRQRLDWLLDEIAQLTRENRRLLKENEKLRQEITLLRLHQEGSSPTKGKQKEGATSVPHEALAFYEQLPPCLNFAMFFRQADSCGISSEQAKRYLLRFLREDMLLQKGSHIKKTDVLNDPVGSAL